MFLGAESFVWGHALNSAMIHATEGPSHIRSGGFQRWNNSTCRYARRTTHTHITINGIKHNKFPWLTPHAADPWKSVGKCCILYVLPSNFCTGRVYSFYQTVVWWKRAVVAGRSQVQAVYRGERSRFFSFFFFFVFEGGGTQIS